MKGEIGRGRVGLELRVNGAGQSPARLGVGEKVFLGCGVELLYISPGIETKTIVCLAY